MNILIAEDEPISAKVLAKAVAGFGHEVTLVDDGQEAWEQFLQKQPDVLITDWMMPILEGPELCRRIRATSGGRYTYIILLTARGDKTDRHEAMSAGADDFLAKPLDTEDLASRLIVAERILEMQLNLEEKNAALMKQQGLLSEKNRQLERSQLSAEVASGRFSQLFSNLPVPCFTFDKNCIVFEMNAKLCECFGKEVTELFERSVVDLFGPNLVTEERLAKLERVLQGDVFQEDDWNDSERYLLVSGYPLTGHDRTITGGIATAVDVTEMRRMQEDLKEANKRFEAMAITDGLTQIPNHRAFQDRLSSLMSEQARGRGRGFALVMLDVDNFKRFNDDFGHQAGDEVLVEVARTLRENIRKIDIAARYGGEEFCVLLLDVDESRAAKLAEKLRRKVSEIENPYRQITVSVGVALYCAKWPTEQSLIKAADDALYRAKAKGKNCVVLADSTEEVSAA